MRLETMAKIQTTEMAARVAVQALELFGGYGVLKDHPVEKLARDAITLLHTSGGNDGMRAGLAKLTPRFDWGQYFTGLGAPDVAPVSVTSPDYLARFSALTRSPVSSPTVRQVSRYTLLRCSRS